MCEFNAIANLNRFADIEIALGENIDGLNDVEAAEAAIAAIRRLSADVETPAGLSELGVEIKEEDLTTMAQNAQPDATMLTNPRTAKVEQIIAMYKAAI